ncbi:hypothetical protein BaRGS_00002787 [Batillaria attramentaria]|uniref:Uncharacterized protein n=1 Tax=Batillaria attramentaria TaxID=370345 RepID=A0ABD0M2T3_9CAEN
MDALALKLWRQSPVLQTILLKQSFLHHVDITTHYSPVHQAFGSGAIVTVTTRLSVVPDHQLQYISQPAQLENGAINLRRFARAEYK